MPCKRLLSLRHGPLLAVLIALLPALRVQADPVADVAKYSAFSQVDLPSLAAGKIQTSRGPALQGPRDLGVQALYLVHAPVARTLELHRQWDAGKHPELKVYIHRDFSTHPALADFTQPLPGNGAVRRLSAATEKLPNLADLQLSNAEAATFKGATVQSFWSQVLFHRATGFLSRGVAGEPPYDTVGGSIRAAEEFSRLLREQPKVRSAFGPIIDRSPLGGGGGSLPLMPYWELFDAEGQAAFNLGASASLQTGDSAQMADIQYFASGGFYAYVTLYQMWPVTVEGKPATLVWRVDSISTQSVADLGPFDRMGSGAAMSKEIQRIVGFFLKDVER